MACNQWTRMACNQLPLVGEERSSIPIDAGNSLILSCNLPTMAPTLGKQNMLAVNNNKIFNGLLGAPSIIILLPCKVSSIRGKPCKT
jgi:hypothetical protein